jgi:hypothetical protein
MHGCDGSQAVVAGFGADLAGVHVPLNASYLTSQRMEP